MSWVAYILTVLLLGLFQLLCPNAAATGALAALILVPPLSWGMLWMAKDKMRLELAVPVTAQKNGVIRVSAKLVNRSVLPAGRLKLTVSAENSVTGQRLRRKLDCGGSVSWEMESGYCGCIRVNIEKARMYDPFGLMWVELACPKEKRTVIMPDTFPVLIQQEACPAPMDDCQDYAPDRKGQDRTETWQLRGYVPGDSLVQIHWKLSSKLDQLMVREPGCPVDQDLMVFVDRCWGDITPAVADAVMEAAVSVCQSLTEDAVPFHLVWNEETVVSYGVAEADSLPEAVSALLRSRTQSTPGTDVYIGLYGPARVSRVIYIGTRIPESLDEFGAHTQTVCLLCSDSEGSARRICFSPEDLREKLAQVSWS